MPGYLSRLFILPTISQIRSFKRPLVSGEIFYGRWYKARAKEPDARTDPELRINLLYRFGDRVRVRVLHRALEPSEVENEADQSHRGSPNAPA
jgi:hypothetical protein